MAETNRFIQEVFLPRFNKVFKQDAGESGSAFVPMSNVSLKDILCLVP